MSPILAGRSEADQRELALGVLRQQADGRWVWKLDPAYSQQGVQHGPPRRPALWPALQRLQCPTLVVRGMESDVLSETQARRMVEVGAAQLAAVHRTKEDLAQLESCIAEMRTGHQRNDLDLFVDADIAFHDVIMRASGNIFVPFMFEPFGELLVQARRQTSAVPAVQDHAIAEHEHILECLVGGDPVQCRAAMESHMSQTQADLRNIVTSQPNRPSN